MSRRTVLQMFHWYTPGDGWLWREVAARAEELAAMGVTDLWLPPAYKAASGAASVGYDVYDLFDLGEFDQKGSVATRYGTRAGLEAATGAAREAGLRVLHDVVFNHRMGADEAERVLVRRADPQDRTQIEPDAFEADVPTRFTFPGRAGTHSAFVWDAQCFSGVDRIANPDEDGVFRIVNDYGDGQWSEEVDAELGNFDYLMGADVEFRNRAVVDELKTWGRWLASQVPCDGFRLDAVKHVPAWFFREWIGAMREAVDPALFVVGEYWSPDVGAIGTWLERIDWQAAAFDAPLQYRFHEASRSGGQYDMRTIFADTLVAAHPDHAVTIVANHDTQPLQSLEAPVEPWFKPIAYALILLRENGVPCIFLPDLIGARYTDTGGDGAEHEVELPPIACLPALVTARQRFANGPQTDLFDDPQTIGFIRHGTQSEPGCVVVIATGEAAAKPVDLGPDQAGVTFIDWLGHCQDRVTTDAAGKACFVAPAGSLSVWVRPD